MAASRKRHISSCSTGSCSDISLLVSTNDNGTLRSVSPDQPEKECYTYDPLGHQEICDRILPLLAHRRSKSGTRSLRERLPSFECTNADDFVQQLEKYVSEMARTDTSTDDVWAQLHQKEADLLLAAELGKALLEKNEELNKQQERLVEQYSKKLEALEQEKHLLRRRLQITEEENEARILELQSDIRDLSGKLESRETSIKQSEREKTSLIADLTSQNNRLTNQLKEASTQEILLTAQLQGLRDQCSMRKTSLQDHVISMDTLREELQLVVDKKSELEKRLQTALNERETMASQLDESNDRVMLLERHVREQELKYEKSLTDMERLQRENSTLSERLGPGALGPNGMRRSLQAELDGGNGTDCGIPEQTLQAEAVHVYKQLRALCQHLRSTHDNDSGLQSDLSIDMSIDGVDQAVTLKSGVLTEVVEDLSLLVAGLEGVKFKDMLEKLSQKLHERDTDLQSKNDKILELQTKLTVSEVELSGVREELESARADAAGGGLAKDEAVAEARAARDAAQVRRTKAEADLARLRVELVQSGSQLLEAVRQKVELSQQLDQWQMDMQELIEEQMKTKLSSQERKRKVDDTNRSEPTRTSKILGFFQR